MIDWTPEGIGFLKDAAVFTGFYDELAAHAAEFSNKGDNVCDAGCGIGMLSGALSKRERIVTGVDVSHDAIQAARKITDEGSGLQFWEKDVFAMSKSAVFDSMVFCFFGSVRETLRVAYGHCKGYVVMFRKNWRMRRFTTSPQPNHRIRFTEAEDELKELGIPFDSHSFDLEMGQPFRCFDDALKFFSLYGKDPDPGLIRSRLTATDSKEFPLFLPERKSVGLIAIRTEDIAAVVKEGEKL